MTGLRHPFSEASQACHAMMNVRNMGILELTLAVTLCSKILQA